jgi:hypothetical protein
MAKSSTRPAAKRSIRAKANPGTAFRPVVGSSEDVARVLE